MSDPIDRKAAEKILEESLAKVKAEVRDALQAAVALLDQEDLADDELEDQVLGFMLDAQLGIGEMRGFRNAMYDLFASGALPAGTEGNGPR